MERLHLYTLSLLFTSTYYILILTICIIICLVILSLLLLVLLVLILVIITIIDSQPLLINSFLSYWFFAKWACVIVSKPPLYALWVEVVFLITWQWHNFILTGEIIQTNSTLLKSYILFWIELSPSQVLHKTRRCRHPIWTLGSSNLIVKHRNHNTNARANAATLQHFKVSQQQH